MKWIPLTREHLYMRPRIEQLQDKPEKKKGLKWVRKDSRWVMKKKTFRIYSMQMGQSRKYKLSEKENSFLWNEINTPANASFEVAENDRYLYFVLLIEGVRRSNIFRQQKN